MRSNTVGGHDEDDDAESGRFVLTAALPTAVTVLLVAALAVWFVGRAGEARSTVQSAPDPRTQVPSQVIAAAAGGEGAVVPVPSLTQPRPAVRLPYVVYLVEREEQRAALGVPEGSSDALVVIVSGPETLAATLGLVQMLAMGASEEPVAREVRVVDLRH